MKTKYRFYLVPLLLLLAIWSGWFIHQSSFMVNGERWYSLFDDAMISMTYAKNFTQGHGLNWAKFGDPIEGFSSPLWTFLMIPFQLLPIAWGKVSLVFSIFCALINGLNVVLLDRILCKRLGLNALLPRLAATFTLAFLYPLNYWSIMGMECGPQVLIFLLGIDQFLAFDKGKELKHLWRLGAVLAAAMLLRMDMVFMVFWTIVFMAPWLIKNRLAALKFLMITGLPMAAYLVFRMAYFHDFLPNTYYLKLYKIPLHWRLVRGWYHFENWAEPLWLIWALLPLMMIPLRRQKVMWLSLILIINYFAYNVYIGGDAWEDWDIGANRFTIVTIPWILVILVAGGSAWAEKLKGKAGRMVQIALPVLSCLLVFALINGIMFVPSKMKNLERLMVIQKPFNTDFQMWNCMRAMEMNIFLGPTDRAATVQAGDIGYFANCELVDILGYNDRLIAREAPYWQFQDAFPHWYVPGHVKVNYKHIIEDFKPDYVIDRWTKFNGDVENEFQALLAAGNYVKYPTGGWIKADFPYPGK